MQDDRQQELPNTAPAKETKEFKPPEGFWVEQGTLFTRCPDCGLVLSADTAKKKEQEDGKIARRCLRCGGNVDPNFVVTQQLIDRCEGVDKAGTKPKKEEKTAPAAPKEDECTTCGSRLTRTSLGIFCSRGCEQPPKEMRPGQEAKPTPPPRKPAEEIAAAAEPRQKDTVTIKQTFKDNDPDKVTHAMASDVASTGDTVTVTFGKETFCPVRDNFFGFGEFTMTTKVRPGETAIDAMERVQEQLNEFAEQEYKRKLAGFVSRMERAAKATA